MFQRTNVLCGMFSILAVFVAFGSTDPGRLADRGPENTCNCNEVVPQRDKMRGVAKKCMHFIILVHDYCWIGQTNNFWRRFLVPTSTSWYF